MSKRQFPDGFLWGAASASYQVEGNIENSDWAVAARAGKVPPAGRAADHYRRFEADFDIAQSIGHNAHRFSIEWSRIEPEEGKFDREAVEHYRTVLTALRARSLRPMVTLWHFTLPQWLAEKGGCESKKFPEYFERYARHIIKELGADDILFVTMNEPLVLASQGWWVGKWPPFKHRSLRALLRGLRNLSFAHKKAYAAMHEERAGVSVGIAKHNFYVRADSNPVHRVRAVLLRWFWNRRFLNKIREHQDFIGLNYYRPYSLGAQDESGSCSDMGWPIVPEGIHRALLELRRYGVPVYITENGIADAADSRRAAFVRDHLRYVHRAIADGTDVRGYFHWALTDNFEWAEGFTKRFGLVEIDFDTQERRVRPSAQVFKQICEENAVE